MTHLLDTNTCIQHLRYGPASPVTKRIAAANPGDLAVCSVVVSELLYGARRSKDVVKSLAEVRKFCRQFPSLPVDDAAAEEAGEIRADLAAKGTPIGPNDLLIAAVAVANGLTLVTHNTAEFSRVVGLKLEDWQI